MKKFLSLFILLSLGMPIALNAGKENPEKNKNNHKKKENASHSDRTPPRPTRAQLAEMSYNKLTSMFNAQDKVLVTDNTGNTLIVKQTDIPNTDSDFDENLYESEKPQEDRPEIANIAPMRDGGFDLLTKDAINMDFPEEFAAEAIRLLALSKGEPENQKLKYKLYKRAKASAVLRKKPSCNSPKNIGRKRFHDNDDHDHKDNSGDLCA